MKSDCSLTYFSPRTFSALTSESGFPLSNHLALPGPHSHPGIFCSHDLSLQLSGFLWWFDTVILFLPTAPLTPSLQKSSSFCSCSSSISAVSTGSKLPQCLLWGSAQALSHQLSDHSTSSLPWTFSLFMPLFLVGVKGPSCAHSHLSPCFS